MWGVSLTHPVLTLLLYCFFVVVFYLGSFSSLWLHFDLGGFTDTSHAGLIFIWGVFPTYPVLASFFIWGVSLTHPMLALLFCGEFLLHIPSSLFFFFFKSGKFLLHIRCWLHFYLGSFSYTSRADFVFMWGVSLTHPVLPSFLYVEFLLHILCWLHFYLGSFTYTSHVGFIFIWGVSLTHPMLYFLFCGQFLLHIPGWLLCFVVLCFCFPSLASFSYTSHAGFTFLWGVSLAHPMLA